jgi:hypothetical protein
MSDDILQVDKKLHEFMKNLVQSPILTRESLDNIPSNGLYAFYEDNKPIYVGISGQNRMKTRIQEHSRPSSNSNTAPFAFNIAKDDAKKNKIDISGKREILEKKPEFKKIFTLAKERVSKMQVRVVEINDPHFRALFEIYATLVLNTTEYNSFETH